jgi:hypothetical protein
MISASNFPHEPEGFSLEQAEDDIAELRGQVDVLSEIIKLNLQGLPNNPATGEVELYGDADSRMLGQVLQSGFNGVIPFTFKSWAPGNTVTGTSLSNLASFSVNANDATVGINELAIYQLEVWGNGTWSSSAAAQLNLQAAFGGNTSFAGGVTIAASQWPASQAFRCHVTVRAICLASPGATASWSSLIFGEVTAANATIVNTTGGAQSTIAFCQCESTGSQTVDSTVANTLGLSASWSVTTGAPTITSRVAFGGRIT